VSKVDFFRDGLRVFAAAKIERYDGWMPRFRTLLLFCCTTLMLLPCLAQQPASRNRPANTAATRNEALIDALTTYPFGEVYSEDISNINSIAYSGKPMSDNPGDGVVPPPQLRAIGELGQAAIPLLIKHLDDQRPTQATYRQQPVSVGYLVLDLLLHMTDMNDERVMVPGCEHQGLGDCMQPEFYFSPDTRDPNVLESVKKEWKDENQKQPINFIYPPWWRPEAAVAPAQPSTPKQ
jgi:hypothetical protein